MTYITKFGEIPKEHLISMGDTEFVRLGGLLWLAQQQGVYRCETRDVSVSPDEIIYECKGWLIPSDKYLEIMGIDKNSPLLDMFKQPVVTHGTTNPDNLKSNMVKFRTVMAETRAIVRNLRILTGCSLCGEDELDSYQFVPEKVIASMNNAGIAMTSAVDLLDAQPEPKNRKEYIIAIQTLCKKNAGVLEYANSFIDAHNANLLVNLSDPLLKELYTKSLELIAE
jgi:hypothetical protein